MLTTLYSVKNETGKPVAKMYGYHAIKSLVKEGRKFTAETVKRSKVNSLKLESSN